MQPTSQANRQDDEERSAELAVLQQRLLACRLCQKHGYLAHAQPLVSGRISDRIMVIAVL